MGVSKNRDTWKWMVKIVENPVKIDDLGVHSGKLTVAMNNGTLEDVFPSENGDIPASYVSLPEGIAIFGNIWIQDPKFRFRNRFSCGNASMDPPGGCQSRKFFETNPSSEVPSLLRPLAKRLTDASWRREGDVLEDLDLFKMTFLRILPW